MQADGAEVVADDIARSIGEGTGPCRGPLGLNQSEQEDSFDGDADAGLNDVLGGRKRGGRKKGNAVAIEHLSSCGVVLRDVQSLSLIHISF